MLDINKLNNLFTYFHFSHAFVTQTTLNVLDSLGPKRNISVKYKYTIPIMREIQKSKLFIGKTVVFWVDFKNKIGKSLVLLTRVRQK